jgi:hypothetical protein
MEEITFKVQGSVLEPYDVLFVRRSPANISAYCTCPAGENGQCCKHRFSILDGIEKGVVSDNTDQVAIVKSWLPGTDVEVALKKVQEIEIEAAKIKKQLSAAKKDVAKAMRD